MKKTHVIVGKVDEHLKGEFERIIHSKNFSWIGGDSSFVRMAAEALIAQKDECLARPLRFMTEEERDQIRVAESVGSYRARSRSAGG